MQADHPTCAADKTVRAELRAGGPPDPSAFPAADARAEASTTISAEKAVPPRSIMLVVLAHNEERRIAACLASLPLDASQVVIHVVVNGARDATAAIARQIARRHDRVRVHEYAAGGKARSWNRFLLDEAPAIEAGAPLVDAYVMVDGDAEVLPGSVSALAGALAAHPAANAASAMPANGRRAAHYRAVMARSHGLFGDLYALSGDFVRRMRAAKIRLPEDLIGDDGLICAMAKTNLASEADWDEARVITVPAAGFLCAPVSLAAPASLMLQYRRMVNYSTRHWQNRIISAIMRELGPAGLPPRLASLYPQWLGSFAPRADPAWWWFDRVALARMRASVPAA